LLVTAGAAINATFYEKLSFNFIRDITAVAGIVRVPSVMVVHPSVPATTVPEFIAYAKSKPGKTTIASAGKGAPSHLAGELFKIMAGVDMVHVPYRGGGPAVADPACERCGYLEGGQVARHRNWHGPAHLKGASNEPARGGAMTSGPSSPTVCYGALAPR